MPPRVRQNQMMVDGEFAVPTRPRTTPATRTTQDILEDFRNIGGSIDPLEAPILDRTITETQGSGGGNGGNAGGQGTTTTATTGGNAAESDKKAARDMLKEWLATFFGISSPEYTEAASWVDNLVINEGWSEDTLLLEARKQPFYKTRFKANEQLVKAGLAELDPAEYLRREQQYSESLRNAGLSRLATRDTFAQLIGGQVSAIELQDRIVNVYDRIVNADEALKNQLQSLKMRTGLTDQDFAESLLLGEEGSNLLQKKIRQAEIRSEAARRNLTSRLGDVELERLGLTRAQAAAGFEAISTELQPLERLSQIYERQAPAAAPEIQTELERETFLGQTSQRRRRLVQQETATFAGSAGTTPTLASRARAGQF